jgi:hypothetical protein
MISVRRWAWKALMVVLFALAIVALWRRSER